MKLEFNEMIRLAILIVSAVIVVILSNYLSSKVIKNSDKMHRRFLSQLVNLIIILVVVGHVIGYFDPNMNVSSIMLKGSALIVAIVGFAAQTAISDLICGFLISISKPFEIGDRIVVEGMEPGIVEDITLRHTVIRIYDGLRVVIPNSVLNSKTVVNTSYMSDRCGIHLTFSVGYDTDVPYAMDTITDCVADSPYTLGVETNGIKEDSGPVYFLKFADSALVLETTIWVTKDTNSYIATTDINNRVTKAFRERGIEIPYNFVNVVEREYVESEGGTGKKKKALLRRRHYRTDTVNVRADGSNLNEALGLAHNFAARQHFDEKAAKQMELMAEELMGIMGNIVEDKKAKFWIEGSGFNYRLHLRYAISVGSEEYKKLISLSTSGKNEAVTTLAEKIWEKMIAGIRSTGESENKEADYVWSIREHEEEADNIGESILAAIADDIKVSVTKDRVDLMVIKSTGA